MALIVVMATLAAAWAEPHGAFAQTFSSADLEGTWEVFQLATPKGSVTGDDVRTYRGQVTFDAMGVVTGVNLIADNAPVTSNAFLATGNFSVSAGGVVTGTLLLTNTDSTGPSGSLIVREARLLTNRHTIVGASTVLGQVGLFTFAKREDGQTFGVADLGGTTTADWNYAELTPGNQGTTSTDSAAWVNGIITFHGTDSNPGCSVADLVLSDGTIRAQRTDGDGTTAFG